jgi:hypothetical protein
MRRYALFAFTFAWLAACETPPSAPTPLKLAPSAPSFAKIANEWFALSGVFLGQCPPLEPIAFTGKLHFLFTGDATDNSIKINLADFHGVGLVSGDRYVFQENYKDRFVVSGPSFTFEARDYFRIIRQGSEDNFHAHVRVSFPPPSVEIETDCRG